MKKKLLAILLCFTILTGCWDREELNEIGLVLAVALDKDILTNDIIISCEVARPHVLKQDSSSNKAPIEIVSAKGTTVFEAVRNISKKFDRKNYFAHNKVIIISEKLAEEGVTPILDVFVRDPETRLLVWVVIAKDTEAKQLLKEHQGLAQIQAFYLNDLIKVKWANSEVQVLNILDFYKKILKSGINPTTGAMTVKKEFDTSNINLSHTAVFKKDRLIGYLDNKETRGLNWVINEIKSGIINVPGIKNNDKSIAIEIKESKSKIIPKIKDGKISFTIEIKELGNIGEIQDTTNILELDLLKKLEEEQKHAIEEEIKAAVEKAKNDFHSDIFGFGYTLYRHYPKEWEKIKDNWDEIFPDTQYELKINVILRRAGEIQTPFLPKE